MTPEQQARQQIDAQLTACGWLLQDYKTVNLSAAPGIALREVPLKTGPCDYLLLVHRKPVGIIEAKKVGTILSPVSEQSGRYASSLPDFLAAGISGPLPFLYESTGVETFFRDERDPFPRSRRVFSFHRPETLAGWAAEPETLRRRLQAMPAAHRLPTAGMRDCQVEAITKLEQSFAADHPRSLIQMATGAGKTFTACAFTYRLVKHAGAKRVLFLVDRANLGRQAKGEFDQFVTPDTGRKFTELYNVQHLTSNQLDHVARVTVCTIQRLYSMLKGEEMDEDLDEKSGFEISAALSSFPRSSRRLPAIGPAAAGEEAQTSPAPGTPRSSRGDEAQLSSDPRSSRREEAQTNPHGSHGLVTLDATQPIEVAYNSALPIETFDFLVTDECHRSIYNLWRQVLEYFDCHLIGLTATPSKQTIGFFNQNLVTEYGHERAVADGVNVGYEVYRIRTEVTEQGGRVEKGFYVDKRHKETRARRWEQLDEDLAYAAQEVDRSVVVPSQIRTVLQAFKEALTTELFPGRTLVPKTLIFCKDDSHAEDVVHLVREVFGRGNDFAKKITYQAKHPVTGKPANAETLIQEFRTSPQMRIAVTVDMIATGTDIKPLECLLFLRDIRSRVYFEQMKGRGTRVLTPTDLQAVSGEDARAKTHFVIVDAVGVCESDKTDSRPLERKPTVAFHSLLLGVALGKRDEDSLTSLAGRLARLDREISPQDARSLKELAGGKSLADLSRALLDAVNPDVIAEKAAGKPGAAPGEVEPEKLAAAQKELVGAACAPFDAPALREALQKAKKEAEQTIDTVTADKIISQGYDGAAKEKAAAVLKSFREYIEANKAEITALQILYSRPYKQRLTESMLKELEEKLKQPFGNDPVNTLWHAHELTCSLAPTGGEGRGEGASVSGSPRPLGRGPHFAERTSLVGEPTGGGLGKPLGQGEGSSASGPPLSLAPTGGEGRGEGASVQSVKSARPAIASERRRMAKKNQPRRFADLVALVRFALEQQPVLAPFSDSVNERFNEWLRQKDAAASRLSTINSQPSEPGTIAFTPDQLAWLGLIKDHIATSLSIDPEDLELSPFNQRGGLGKAHQLFGEQLPKLLDELNEVLAA